jgi:digeranylgeranylglycerophospholipid reductase
VTGAGIASAVQSGALAGRAAIDLIGGRVSVVDEYDEELGDLFDAALGRALRRRRKLMDCYVDGRRPDARALSDSWIASPHYWTA